MLFLTKLLSLLIYPLSLGLLLTGFGLYSLVRGNRAAATLNVLLAFGILYAASTEYGAEALARPLEGRHAAFAPEELPNADVIVLLGGANFGETKFGRGSDYNQAVDRVFAANELYGAGKAPLILVSGGRVDPLHFVFDVYRTQFLPHRVYHDHRFFLPFGFETLNSRI